MINQKNNSLNILLKENEKVLSNKDFQAELFKQLQYNSIDLEKFFTDKNMGLYYHYVICEKIPTDVFFKTFNLDKNLYENNYKEHYMKAIENLRDFIYNEFTIKINIDTISYNEEIFKSLLYYLNQAKQVVKNIEIALWREPKGGFTKELLTKFMDIQSQNINVSVMDSGEMSDYYVSLETAILCYDKFENQIDFIKSKKLSPFEQFLLVHDIVSDRIYKKSNDLRDSAKCRNFIEVMTQDDIVCAGYATMMQHFCEKLGIPCFYISGNQKEIETDYNKLSINLGHAANIVCINDDKYNIHGYYFCDACWDCKVDEKNGSKYFYSALPLQDIDKIGQSKYFRLEELKRDINNLPNKSEPISYKKLSSALQSVYGNENFESSVLDKNLKKLKNDLQLVMRYCKNGSENGFYTEYQMRVKRNNSNTNERMK